MHRVYVHETASHVAACAHDAQLGTKRPAQGVLHVPRASRRDAPLSHLLAAGAASKAPDARAPHTARSSDRLRTCAACDRAAFFILFNGIETSRILIVVLEKKCFILLISDDFRVHVQNRWFWRHGTRRIRVGDSCDLPARTCLPCTFPRILCNPVAVA